MFPEMAIRELLSQHGITQAELALAIKMRPPTLNRKLLERRRFTIAEASRIVAFLRERTKDETLTVEGVFQSSAKRKHGRGRRVAA